MMNLLQLKEILILVLGDFLGVYKFASSNSVPSEAPAIWLEDGSPTPANVEGLEVVIAANQFINIAPLIGGYQVDSPVVVSLKQWDTTQTTIEALELVMSIRDLTILEAIRVPRRENLDNIEISTIRLANGYLSRSNH